MERLAVQARDLQVKAKSLRKAGFIPGCIFGSKLPQSITFQTQRSGIEKLLRKNGENFILQVELGDEKMNVLVKEVTKNTMTGEIEHIGFQALESDKKIRSSAKINLINGEKPSGLISQNLFEIPYTAFPADLVESVTIDLSAVPVDSKLTVHDLELAKNEKIQLLLDTDTLILSHSFRQVAAETQEAGDFTS